MIATPNPTTPAAAIPAAISTSLGRAGCLLLAAGIILSALLGAPAAAQTTPPAGEAPHAGQGRTECPPGHSGAGPKLGETPPGGNLSDQLSDSHGVICPPAGVDPEMTTPPPGGGRTPVIPPPGTAPGDRNVPK